MVREVGKKVNWGSALDQPTWGKAHSKQVGMLETLWLIVWPCD